MSSSQLRKRLLDIRENIARIKRYTAELNEAAFLGDEQVRDAVERCLERIAEAVRKIGPELDEAYPDLELVKLRQFGSVLRHDYDFIEPVLVWKMVCERLDGLDRMCERELSR